MLRYEELLKDKQEGTELVFNDDLNVVSDVLEMYIYEDIWDELIAQLYGVSPKKVEA